LLSVAHFLKRLTVNRLSHAKPRMEKISYEKLSQLQKLILVALSEPRYAVMKRRAFNQLVKRLYYGKDSRVATSNLSRAYQRLEDRQYIARSDGRWTLTDSDPYDNGVMLAFLAWAQKREFYARLGLKGPPLEALGIKPANAGSNTERRGVHVEFVGID
jgi:hypothetical protein